MLLGIDEAGRGPVMGPMVVAAAAHHDQSVLRSMGARDSKEVPPEERARLDVELRKVCRVCLMVVPAEAIDAFLEGSTMNELEVLCFASCIASMHQGRPVMHSRVPSSVVAEISSPGADITIVHADAADVNERRFGERISDLLASMVPGATFKVIAEHKADRDHPLVGAASIIAKVRRDSEMMRIGSELGAAVGSGYPSDPITMAFLTNHVRRTGALPPHSRKSWETSRRVLASSKQKSIESF